MTVRKTLLKRVKEDSDNDNENDFDNENDHSKACTEYPYYANEARSWLSLSRRVYTGEGMSGSSSI
jgi:hypothetical protein